MAYAAVASLLQTVDILLNHHQHSISPQFKTQIISIHQHTSFLLSFLEGSSDRVNNWEETIRQASNKAEDIIELLLPDSLLKPTTGSPRSELECRKYEISYSFDELEKVREEMESITSRVKGGRRIATADGSDEEVMEVVSRLVGGSSSLEMIAIWRSGGMGKTTLADNVWFHPSIAEHFDVRLGSIVTEEYTWVRVIGDILRSMKAEFSESNSEDELIQRLLKILGRRRYLIVLDDVWSYDVLERVKITLPDCGNGSRIIFTTMSSDLAKFAHHIHEMRLLDEDKTWDLLRAKIFKGDPCPFQLEAIGKMIARNCGGHMLSICVISGILATTDQTKAAWEDVSENIKIASQEEGDKLYEVLYLSYIYLPHYLRPCFLYLGIFPQNCYIGVSRLVKLWAAEGFVNERGYKSLEETGEEYVEDLVSRSLVSIYRRKFNGRIKSIMVHDLIRGICLRQAHIDNFKLDLEGIHRHTPVLEVKEIIKSCRRLSDLSFEYLSDVYGSTIRTILLHLEYDSITLRCWMRNVRLLRILDLLKVKSYSLSTEVYELFHLRFLASYCEFNIPQAISNLENLHTLIIGHAKCGIFENLPDGIWRMLQLRHLYIVSFKFSIKKGSTSAALENLQTLSQVVDFVCSRDNLKMIPNLKRLVLLYTKNWRDAAEDYELHNLSYLRKLEILKIETDLCFEEVHKMRLATFPLTLKKLTLLGLQLSWGYMKIIALLPNLEVLKLKNQACVGDTWETNEGGFSRLFFLQIEDSDLKDWITESSHFPRLGWLMLVRCLSLLEIPNEMAEIPTLHLINLDGTNDSLLRSAEWIQHDRYWLGLDPLHVYVV